MEQEVRYDVRKENDIEVKLTGRKCDKCKIGEEENRKNYTVPYPRRLSSEVSLL